MSRRRGRKKKERQEKRIIPNPRHIGYVGGELKHAVWKYGNLKTMEELFEKGVLNQSQIEMLHEQGVDIYAKVAKNKLSELDLEKDEDFVKFAEIVREYPGAVKLMNQIEKDRKRAATRERNIQLKNHIKKLDMDTPGGMQEFAAILKEHPEAMGILNKLQEEEE